MALLAFSDDPETGQRVWIEERMLEGRQPNGKIINIDKQAGEFDVLFEDTTRGSGWVRLGGDTDCYPVDILEGKWTDSLDGYWHVEADRHPGELLPDKSVSVD
jgi:hypothetical protein